MICMAASMPQQQAKLLSINISLNQLGIAFSVSIDCCWIKYLGFINEQINIVCCYGYWYVEIRAWSRGQCHSTLYIDPLNNIAVLFFLFDNAQCTETEQDYGICNIYQHLSASLRNKINFTLFHTHDTHTHKLTHTQVNLNTNIHIHAQRHAHTHKHRHACTKTHIQTQTHMHTHNTHTHTNKHTGVLAVEDE